MLDLQARPPGPPPGTLARDAGPCAPIRHLGQPPAAALTRPRPALTNLVRPGPSRCTALDPIGRPPLGVSGSARRMTFRTRGRVGQTRTGRLRGVSYGHEWRHAEGTPRSRCCRSATPTGCRAGLGNRPRGGPAARRCWSAGGCCRWSGRRLHGPDRRSTAAPRRNGEPITVGHRGGSCSGPGDRGEPNRAGLGRRTGHDPLRDRYRVAGGPGGVPARYSVMDEEDSPVRP